MSKNFLHAISAIAWVVIGYLFGLHHVALDILQWTFDNQVKGLGLLAVEFALGFEIYNRARDHWFFEPLVIVAFGPIFLIQDVILNAGIVSLIFWDKPGNFGLETITMRMKRYKREYGGLPIAGIEKWRYKGAVTLCKHLNKPDPRHC